MVMIYIERIVRDRNGDLLPGAKAFVSQRLEGGERGGPLPVYDAEGNVIDNPAIADATGVVRLWVDGTSAAHILITSASGDPRLEIETMPNSNVVYEARLKRVEDRVSECAAAIQKLINAPAETVDLSGVLSRLEALENRPDKVAGPPPEIVAERRDGESNAEMRVRLSKELVSLYGLQDYRKGGKESLTDSERHRMKFLESQDWLKG